MFAYCNNNSVSNSDYSGSNLKPNTDIIASGGAAAGGGIIMALIMMVCSWFSSKPSSKTLTTSSIRSERGLQYSSGNSAQLCNSDDSSPTMLAGTEELTLSDTASKYGLGKCKEAAYAMAEQDNRRGKYIIMLYYRYAVNGNVCAPKSIYGCKEAISTNGYHWGYCDSLGIVHCNIFPLGLPEPEWINSFSDAWGSPPEVTRIPLS